MSKPGAKFRRVLVISSDHLPDGRRLLTVCYGTGQGNSAQASSAALKPYQIEIPADPNGQSGARLDETTRFDLSKTVSLPWDSVWFRNPPVNYGRLNKPDRATAFALWAQLP